MRRSTVACDLWGCFDRLSRVVAGVDDLLAGMMAAIGDDALSASLGKHLRQTTTQPVSLRNLQHTIRIPQGEDRPQGTFDDRSDPWLGGPRKYPIDHPFTCEGRESSDRQLVVAVSPNVDRSTPVPVLRKSGSRL